MTINITVATPRFVICATDRRLTNFETGEIVTERSTKLTQLVCKDALALIAYNGIGLVYGKTPADWLQELNSKVELTTLPFKDVLQEIRKEAEQRIATLPIGLKDKRHTFTIGAWEQDRAWICTISNYEGLDSEDFEIKARDYFSVDVLPDEPGKETRVLVTGAVQHFNREDMKRVGQVAKKGGAAGSDIKNLCVQAIQNSASRQRKTGGISTSVLWAIAERFKGVESGLDVLGGTTVYEMPNMIVPGMQMKDIRYETPRGDPVSWGKLSPLPELKCRYCSSPVPLGYNECGVCRKKT